MRTLPAGDHVVHGSAEEGSPERRLRVAGEKILNIDDSPTVQRLIEMILSSQGYEVILAADGEAGIAKAKAEKPAVILVDFVMPKMNGFQVCKSLKEDPEFKDTPIILVTSKGDKVGSKFVDTLGITDFFTKPFQPEDLLGKIREVIDKKNAAKISIPAAEPGYSSAMPAAAPPPEATPSEMQALPAALEAAVRQLIAREIGEFVTKSLPDMIKREIAKLAPADAVTPAQSGIRGALSSFRIVEVMQMLGLQRQTGRLSVSRSEESAEVYFRDGSVSYATASNGIKPGAEGLIRKTCRLGEDGIRHVLRIAEMTGQPVDAVLVQEKMVTARTFTDNLKRHTESVVFKIMSWREGDFFFDKSTPVALAAPLRLKVDDLLLEGARRADEWTLIEQKISNFDMVFESLIRSDEELASRGMSDIDLKVFPLIDGTRTVRDIIDASCLSDFDVAKSLFILLSVNLIRVRT